MPVYFYGETKITNSQFGDESIMNIYTNQTPLIITEPYWKELMTILTKRLEDGTLQEPYNLLTKEALNYVNKKDETGFKKFWTKNKDNFFTNVLSGLVSSGLSLLLGQL